MSGLYLGLGEIAMGKQRAVALSDGVRVDGR